MITRCVIFVVVLGGCLPQAQPQAQAQAQARPSGCREDIPECVAACALRETSRPRFTDFFDQRCATAILGKPPESVADAMPPSKVDLLDTR